MSAVIEAVVSVVESVVDAVGDVVEAVGDVVEKAVDTIGNVVEAVINDPVPVLLSVAGSFVGIPPMVTMGAITAARGGDLEDIALSMGTAYFGAEIAPGISNSISSTVSSTFVEAGLNETFSQVASESISKGLINGTIAEVKGGNFEDGFAGGFTGGLVAGGVGEVGSYVKDDVIALAQDSGLNLKDATSLYNAGTRALSAGVTSEITGRGDFATSFANSAIGSSIDAGTRSLNSTIDEQFKTAATNWNEEDKEGEPIDTTPVGAGIPNDIVGQVTVSSIGVDATADTNKVDTTDNSAVNTANVLSNENATSNISVLPETILAQAPKAETVNDFSNLTDGETPVSAETILTENNVPKVPSNVTDIADNLTTTAEVPVEPKGALATVAQASNPADVLSVIDPTVVTDTTVSEAPIAKDLLTVGAPVDQPVGGLNATAIKTEDQKMAESLGLKPTDITKPIVASVGSLLKSTLKQGTKPPARPVAKKPAGALQTMAGVAKPKAMPPAKMDVAKLIPIQKAAPAQPAKTLASTAKLSPVTNIAGLTSMLKKTG